MNWWAIVPVKPLAQAKSRLAEVLSPEARADLVLTLFKRTASLLVATQGIARVLVVSADLAIGAAARACHADFLQEADTPGLNISLSRAITVAAAGGSDGVLIVPGDVPCLGPAGLTGLLAAAGSPPVVVIAPDRHGVGTNGLLLAPPGAIQPRFGPGSCEAHFRAAEQAGVRSVIWNHPEWAQDVDFPEDLAAVPAGVWQKKSSQD